MQNTRYSCQILMKLEFSPTFETYLNVKFNKNPSSGSRVQYGQTDRHTDITKLIVAFRNFANALKNRDWDSRGVDISGRL
jgi:hypothetical protein